MITESEYLKAKAIVDQYERDEFEEKQRQADEEICFDEDDDEDDILERRENESFERALSCSCGAWILSQDKTNVLHVADCICGAD
jgi:hypothetical protein